MNDATNQNPLYRAWLGYLSYAGLINTIAGLTGTIVMFFAMAHRPRLESTVLKNHIALCSTEAITYALMFGFVAISMLILIAFMESEVILRVRKRLNTALIFKIMQRTAVSSALGILGAFLGFLFDGTLYFASTYGIFILNILNIIGLLWLAGTLSSLSSDESLVA